MLNRVAASCALILINSPVYAFDFSFKGMIKSEVVTSSQGVASFGGAYSQVAPTHALRTDIFGGAPATEQQTNFLESESTSFQAAQSRFSLNMNHEKIRSVLEFDFIDVRMGLPIKLHFRRKSLVFAEQRFTTIWMKTGLSSVGRNGVPQLVLSRVVATTGLVTPTAQVSQGS